MSLELLEPPTSAPPTDRLVTGEELLRHPEWGPCELIRGKVVKVCRPNNEHGLLVPELSMQIGNFNRKHKIGRLFAGDSGVYMERNPDTVRGPDLHFVREERWDARTLEGYLEVAPDLCIEIVSPSDSWIKLEEKVTQFLDKGSRLVWAIDPQNRRARIYRRDGSANWSTVLSGEDVLPGFELPLKDLFAVLD